MQHYSNRSSSTMWLIVLFGYKQINKERDEAYHIKKFVIAVQLSAAHT